MPSISAVADFYRGTAFFLPALPYQPFPLEGLTYWSDLYFSRASCPAFFFLVHVVW